MEIILGQGTHCVSSAITAEGEHYLLIERGKGTGVVAQPMQARQIVDIDNLDGVAIKFLSVEAAEVVQEKIGVIVGDMDKDFWGVVQQSYQSRTWWEKFKNKVWRTLYIWYPKLLKSKQEPSSYDSRFPTAAQKDALAGRGEHPVSTRIL